MTALAKQPSLNPGLVLINYKISVPSPKSTLFQHTLIKSYLQLYIGKKNKSHIRVIVEFVVTIILVGGDYLLI